MTNYPIPLDLRAGAYHLDSWPGGPRSAIRVWNTDSNWSIRRNRRVNL